MRNKNTLLIEQLDKKTNPFLGTKNTVVPEKGWINTIRVALNMTLAQLGSRLNITRQGAKRIEESESNGSISLNSLKEVANAMDMILVYALVPKKGTFEDLINDKAESLARKIVARTNQNMILEDQGVGYDNVEKNIKELTNDIKRELKKSIWD